MTLSAALGEEGQNRKGGDNGRRRFVVFVRVDIDGVSEEDFIHNNDDDGDAVCLSVDQGVFSFLSTRSLSLVALLLFDDHPHCCRSI